MCGVLGLAPKILSHQPGLLVAPRLFPAAVPTLTPSPYSSSSLSNPRSMVPLLQVISRGSPMSFEDSSRIIPLFYLFSSLFSHSLISIHDNEFFGDPIEGKTAWE